MESEAKTSVISARAKTSFKYSQLTMMKAIHKRLHCFMRLIDLMIMETLRKMVSSAIKTLRVLIDASLCGSQSKNETPCSQYSYVDDDAETFSLVFEVCLFIEKGEPSNTMDSNGSRIQCTSYLLPSLKDFENDLTALFKRFEDVALSFDSLLDDRMLKKFIEVPTRGNSEINQSLSEVGKGWPDQYLLFGSDMKYQKCITNILNNVGGGMQSVIDYTTLFDKFCHMITSVDISEVEQSLQKEWSVEQFSNVLSQYSEQVAAMENMPVCQRKGLFLVKTDVFKQACLSHPTNVINLVNKHLPVIANKKNEALLKIIRNGTRILSAEIKSVAAFVEYLSFLQHLSDDIPMLENEFHIINKLYTISFRYGAKYTAEEQALYTTLGPSFQHLKSLVMYNEAKKDEYIQKFSDDLDFMVTGFGKQLHQLAYQVQNPSLIDKDTSYDVLQTINFLKEDLEGLSVNAKNFATYEECFLNAMSGASKKTNTLTL